MNDSIYILFSPYRIYKISLETKDMTVITEENLFPFVTATMSVIDHYIIFQALDINGSEFISLYGRRIMKRRSVKCQAIIILLIFSMLFCISIYRSLAAMVTANKEDIRRSYCRPGKMAASTGLGQVFVKQLLK